MRLSWNEIRARAAAFADEWRDAAYEKGETQSFYNAFFEIFGVRRRSVARYEEHVKKLDNRSGFIDLFWPGVLIVEQKSAGRDLARAYGQAGEYFDSLSERDRPRYILVSDFQTFELHDLDEGEHITFPLADLHDHVEEFGFILGVQRRIFRDQDPVNVEASASMGRLHDALEASGYSGHDLEVFLVRTVFCLFADDTGIFEPRDLFLDLLETRTREDGSDLGPALARLFQVLNTPVGQRQAKLDEDLARFPYVNGDLFAARLTIPDFDAAMRSTLIDACRFDWAAISPAIFGALFQSVMDAAERRAQGAHYTTEKNILKVIGPLFLDDLRAEFNRLRARKDKRLFSYPDINGEPEETLHAALSPYLFDAGGLADPHLTVREESRPINGMVHLKTGVQMIDDGILTFSEQDKDEFLYKEPGAAQFFRRYIGGDEYINGFHRWILYLRDANPAHLKKLPLVKELVSKVRRYRSSSQRASTRRMADYPTQVGVDERLDQDYLVIPNTSSERREYVPIGWLGPEVIANQKLRILPDATLADFSLLTSAMHMAWMRTVTGRMKSDYMYSIGVVYNTFPLPPGSSDLSKLEPLAQAVLDARAAHSDATLADLYDPDLMPPNLRRAHQAIDRTVDLLYRRTGFASERERVEHLFMLYEKMRAPLEALMKAKPKRRRARRRSAGGRR